MTQLVVQLYLPVRLSIGISYAPSLVGGEIQVVLQGLSIPKRIGLEVMRQCVQMCDSQRQ